jgi:ABC-2 family transporter protein
MTWLVWRQYRLQAAIAGGLLAAFAVLLLVTGVQMASQWRLALSACTTDHSCTSLVNSLSLGNHAVYDLTILSLIVPGVIGLLIGAPLVAGEVEAGTSNFAWTQSITRSRWLLAKAGWLLLAAAVWGGCVAALVTWWSGPRNALYGNALQPNDFDMQGIVPVAYALFGMALGIAAGALLRRTLPAIAVTLTGFIAVRVVVAEILRPHYMTAVTTYYSVVSNWTQPPGAWVLGSGVVNKSGQVLAVPDIVVNQGGVPNVIEGVPVSDLPAACKALVSAAAGTVTRDTPNGRGAPMGHLGSCIASAGFRQFISYQPISRYWAFQSIETGVFVALAAGLVAVAFAVVRGRDA